MTRDTNHCTDVQTVKSGETYKWDGTELKSRTIKRVENEFCENLLRVSLQEETGITRKLYTRYKISRSCTPVKVLGRTVVHNKSVCTSFV